MVDTLNMVYFKAFYQKCLKLDDNTYLFENPTDIELAGMVFIKYDGSEATTYLGFIQRQANNFHIDEVISNIEDKTIRRKTLGELFTVVEDFVREEYGLDHITARSKHYVLRLFAQLGFQDHGGRTGKSLEKLGKRFDKRIPLVSTEVIKYLY
jgi:hypothetical protein